MTPLFIILSTVCFASSSPIRQQVPLHYFGGFVEIYKGTTTCVQPARISTSLVVREGETAYEAYEPGTLDSIVNALTKKSTKSPTELQDAESREQRSNRYPPGRTTTEGRIVDPYADRHGRLPSQDQIKELEDRIKRLEEREPCPSAQIYKYYPDGRPFHGETIITPLLFEMQLTTENKSANP